MQAQIHRRFPAHFPPPLAAKTRQGLAAAIAIAFAGYASSAIAQDAAALYKGKTVTIAAGSSAGGGLDTYARLLSRHLAKHLPGNPTVIVQNMPGAGSLVAARHLFTVAPRDGTHMAIVLPGALIDALLKGGDRSKYDPTKFNYIGNANAETLVCVTRRDAPVKTFKEAFDRELVIGATGPGSTLVDGPQVLKTVLGAKIKIIAGYKGSREVSLAVKSGEIHGVCGLAWSSAKNQYPELQDPKGMVHVLVQENSREHPELKGKAPLSFDFAKTNAQKEVLNLFYEPAEFTRPFLMPPGVPADRVALMRKAFMETMNSPALQADANKMKTEARASSGEELKQMVDKLYAAKAETVAELKKALAK